MWMDDGAEGGSKEAAVAVGRSRARTRQLELCVPSAALCTLRSVPGLAGLVLSMLVADSRAKVPTLDVVWSGGSTMGKHVAPAPAGAGSRQKHLFS